VAKPDYDLSAMRRALAQCDINVKVFEDAIMKEMNTKMEYQRIIRVLEEAEANKPVVKVEVVEE
jgi:hypothetical protein